MSASKPSRMPPGKACAEPNVGDCLRAFRVALVRVRLRALALQALSLTASSLSAMLLAASVVALSAGHVVASSGRVVALGVGIALLWTLVVIWLRRPTPSELVARLDRTLKTDEVLTTALYCGPHPALPSVSVKRVVAQATELLGKVRWAELLPPRAALHVGALLASSVVYVTAVAVVVPAARHETPTSDVGPHPPPNRLMGNAAFKHWPQDVNEPPPIPETLKLTQHLARQADQAPNTHEIRQRARQLSEFVLHHLTALRTDPNAGMVADYIGEVPDLGNLADAVRRGDWIRFDAELREQARVGASSPTLENVLSRALSIAQPESDARSAGIVAKALTEALSELNAHAQPDSPPRTSSDNLPISGEPGSTVEREPAHANRPVRDDFVHSPGPLPRNDLAESASTHPDAIDPLNMAHPLAQLRSSELDRLTDGANRHPADLAPQKRSQLEHANQLSMAVEQRRLSRALEALRLMSGGDVTNASLGTAPATAAPALGAGAATSRSDQNPYASDGEGNAPHVASDVAASRHPVHVQAQQVRAPLNTEAPLSAGLPGRHASQFGRAASAIPAAERSVHAPERVLPLAHSPVPDEYRAQISRYFAPE